MNGDEILGVLREIRDEAKQTNARLESLEGRVGQTNARLESLEGRVDQTNARLESLDGRVDFLERRLTKGFAEMNESLNALARTQADAEMRVATEVVALAKVTREVRDVIGGKITDHEKRLKAIEKRNGSKKR